MEQEVVDHDTTARLQVAEETAQHGLTCGLSLEADSIEVNQTKHVFDVHIQHVDVQRIVVVCGGLAVHPQVLLLVANLEVVNVKTLLAVAEIAGLDLPFGVVDGHSRGLNIDVGCRFVINRSIEIGNGVQLSAHALQGVVVPVEGVDELVGVCCSLCVQLHVVAVGVHLGDADVVTQRVVGRRQADVSVLVAATIIIELRNQTFYVDF